MNVNFFSQVLEGKPQYMEMTGNLVPLSKADDQLHVNFHAFRENRLPFGLRIHDVSLEPTGKMAFAREPRSALSGAPQAPVSTLDVRLPDPTVRTYGETPTETLKMSLLETSRPGLVTC